MRLDNRMNSIQSQKEKDVIEIDIFEICKVLFKHIGWIIFITIFFALCALFISKSYIAPTYRSSFTAYVNNHSSSSDTVSTVTSSDLSAARSLVKTYSEIITSNSVLESAISDCKANITSAELKKMVETSIPSDTEIITIYVEAYSPLQAMQLASAISEQAQIQISTIIDGTSMSIIDQPNLPTSIYSPSYTKIAVIAGFMGALLLSAIFIISYLLDDKLRDEKKLGEKYNIPVLGVVPNVEASIEDKNKGYGYGYGKPVKKNTTPKNGNVKPKKK